MHLLLHLTIVTAYSRRLRALAKAHPSSVLLTMLFLEFTQMSHPQDLQRLLNQRRASQRASSLKQVVRQPTSSSQIDIGHLVTRRWGHIDGSIHRAHCEYAPFSLSRLPHKHLPPTLTSKRSVRLKPKSAHLKFERKGIVRRVTARRPHAPRSFCLGADNSG